MTYHHQALDELDAHFKLSPIVLLYRPRGNVKIFNR